MEYTQDAWAILNPIEQSIKAKIEKYGTPLKDWDISINYGIKTGCNEAFIISGAKRAELIEQDPKSAEIIRPILRGRDIKRYGYDFADLYLIWVPWHFPCHLNSSITGSSEKAEVAFKEQYPAVYNHLYQYKNKLAARNKSETGIRYEWYALQRWGANYWNDFSKQKIVWSDIATEPTFAVVESGIYFNNTCYMLCDAPTYLVGILNSKLIGWYFGKIATALGNSSRYFKQFVELLPIVENITPEQSALLNDASTYNVTAINKVVCELYGLTPEETLFILNQK